MEADPNRTAGSSSTSAVAFQRLLLEVFQKGTAITLLSCSSCRFSLFPCSTIVRSRRPCIPVRLHDNRSAADVTKFREYCLDVEEFSKAVAFLDEVQLHQHFLCSNECGLSY